MEALLSRGAVAAIERCGAAAASEAIGVQLVLQVFRVMRLHTPGPERHSMWLSDGDNLINALLPRSMNYLVRARDDGGIRRGTVVRLLEFTVGTLYSYRVIEVKQLEVLQNDCEMIGNPKDYLSCNLEDKHEELYAQPVTNFSKLNRGTSSAGQGLKGHLTKGTAALLQWPVMQVVGISLMRSGLHHVILSDGMHTQNAQLSTPYLNHLVKDNRLRKGTIVGLLGFACLTVRTPRIAIAVELEVLNTECELIGSPTFYELRNKQKELGADHSAQKQTEETPASLKLQSQDLANRGPPTTGSIYKDPEGMEVEADLTQGAVTALWEDDTMVAAGRQPVLQVYDVEPCAAGLSPILLSDGEYVTLGVLVPTIINSAALKAGHLCRNSVVRLVEFTRQAMWDERVIVVKELEVLGTKGMIVGNPKRYRVGNFEDKHEESDGESLPSSAKQNDVAYTAGQGLEGNLTRGVAAVLQQPVMQVVTVSLTTIPERKKIGMYNLVLSDGVHTQDVTLRSQLDHLVKNIRLCRGTVIRLLEFMCATDRSPSWIVISKLQILQTECELIGSPKSYELCCVQKPYALESNGFKGHLTGGAVLAVLEGEMTVEQQPVMQVVDDLLLDRNKCDLTGILLSDGVYHLHGLLLPHLRHMVDGNCLRKGMIVRVLQFARRSFENVKFIFISQLEVLQTECELIGSPKSYKLCCTEISYLLEGRPYPRSVANSSQPINRPSPNSQGFMGHLTGGAVAAVLEGKMTLEQQPVMQVVAVQLLDKGAFNPHFISLSDGVHRVNAVLLRHLRHLVDENCIRKGTIIRLLKYVLKSLESERVIAVFKLEVLQAEFELIGSPKLHNLCFIEKMHPVESKCGEPHHRSAASYSQPRLYGQGFKDRLTCGAVEAILNGEITLVQDLVMQVVYVFLYDADRCNRSRVLLSDGVYKMHGLLLPHLRHLVQDNRIRCGTIIRILNFDFKAFTDGEYIYVTELEVLQTECKMIGSPTLYELGNKQKEMGTGHAAYIPADGAAKPTAVADPEYKATPG